MLELLYIHHIIGADSHRFWTSWRSSPTHINGPAKLPSSFSYIFYSCFIITPFLSSAAQPKTCSKHHTHEISRLRVKYAEHYDSTHSCVLRNQAHRTWDSTKVRQQPIVPSTPDLQVEVTKDIQLQLQQVLPQPCRCSLFLAESKGSGLYSSQHDHHPLLLRFLSSLQSYQLTIHCSTANAK